MTSNGLRRQHNGENAQFRIGQHTAPGVTRQQPQAVITSSAAAVKVDVPQVVWIEDNIVVDENYIFFRANPDKRLRHEHVRHKVKSTSPGGVDGAVRWYVDKSYPVARPDFGIDKCVQTQQPRRGGVDTASQTDPLVEPQPCCTCCCCCCYTCKCWRMLSCCTSGCCGGGCCCCCHGDDDGGDRRSETEKRQRTSVKVANLAKNAWS